MTLEARASPCAIPGAPCPRGWPISGAPQTDATGKQSGFQLLEILLLLRENKSKLVRPRARFKSGIRGLNCEKARRSGTFLGLVDRGGGPVEIHLGWPNTPLIDRSFRHQLTLKFMYEAGSAYRMEPYRRSNVRAVDRNLALKIRYSVSDGPRGHFTRLSVPRVGHISRQFHPTSSRSS